MIYRPGYDKPDYGPMGNPFWEVDVDHQLLDQDKHLGLCRESMQISCNYHTTQTENVIPHVYLGSRN